MAPGVGARVDLIQWTIGIRRIAAMVGFGAVVLQRLTTGAGPSLNAIVLVLLVVCAYNEMGRYLLGRTAGARLTAVANVLVGLDTVALTTLLHCGGGLTGLGLLFLATPFFVYGAVLPLAHALGHVGATLGQLTLLAVAERSGLVAHYAGNVFLPAGTHERGDFLALTVVLAAVVSALAAVMGHYLRAVLDAHAESGRSLAVERGTLVALYSQEATRLRMLLDIAQRSAASRSLRELLAAVCDTTAAMAGVTRVDALAWDADEACLDLVASRGLADDAEGRGVRYHADLPIVARLRAGEVVDFDTVPSLDMSASRVDVRSQRAFAAPMVSDGSFQGALVVGYGDAADRAALTELAHGIASQAAIALASVRARVQQRDDAEVSGILLQLSQSLSACLDIGNLWRLILDSARDTLALPWTVTARFDERDGAFELVDAHGLPEPVRAWFAGVLRAGDTPVLREVLSRRGLVVADDSQLRQLLAPGGWRVGAWLVVPLFREGWVAGVLAAGHAGHGPGFDRRQLRLAEGLGHHASIALHNARLVAGLEAADRLKSDFVARMSRELRTPVNLIIGHAERLRDGAAGTLTDEQRELVQRLDARGRELLELVEATLSVPQLAAAGDAVDIGPVEFQELVRALEASTVGLPRPPAVTLEWQVPQDVRGRVMTDRGKLALVVRNLVGNALKFTTEGRVIIRVALRGDSLAIEVHDTGIGIDAEHLPHIFDLSRQVDRPARHEGVGFGLYLVQQFVARLGGRVEVVSAPGRGSRFTVLLPGAVRDKRQAA